MTKNLLMEHYEAHERQLARWKVQIIAYLLGDKYVCIVNNLDPNATICRVSADSRRNAMERAIREANASLARTAIVEVPLWTAPSAEQALVRLDFGGDAPLSYGVPEFVALPMGERMRMILSGSLAFIGADGAALPSDVAMRLLGTATAATAVSPNP